MIRQPRLTLEPFLQLGRGTRLEPFSLTAAMWSKTLAATCISRREGAKRWQGQQGEPGAVRWYPC
jgi:hypothetical protein